MPNLVQLRKQLFDSKEPEVCCRAYDKVLRLAKSGNPLALGCLIDYAKFGIYPGIRLSAYTDLAIDFAFHDSSLEEFFSQGISDPLTRYWCLLGCIRTSGRKAYPLLTAVALDSSASIHERSYAIRLLSIHSGQPFNLACPKSSELWHDKLIKVDEIRSWSEADYPSAPPRQIPDDALRIESDTPIKKVILELDQKLAVERAADPEQPTNPTNYLIPSDPQTISEIFSRWQLPNNYKVFLEHFSLNNLTCHLKLKGSHSGLTLYSANDLIAEQEKYAVKTPEEVPYSGWNPSYFAIADLDLDPVVLDLGSSDGLDAAIMTAGHGAGEFKFRKLCRSFTEFVSRIVVDGSDFRPINPFGNSRDGIHKKI